jgi:hypothetical protein
MPDDLPKYQRLTRPRFGLDGMGSLWLGPDHILLVTNTMTVENYRRWFFRDIQAVVALHNSARLVWNLVCCVLGALLGLGAGGVFVLALNEKDKGQMAVLMVIAGIIAVPTLIAFAIAIVNTVFGPTCAVFVQTPHGLEKLACPKRLLTFNRLVARLQPEIARVQQAVQPASSSNMVGATSSLDDQPLS